MAMQNVIAYSINNWLQDNPGIFRFLHLLGWGVHHPVISLILLVFIIAILGSIIKAIIRLIETASWSIMQIPLKMLLAVLQLSWLSITKVSSLIVYSINQPAKADNLPTLEATDFPIIAADKQKRLGEISQRLTELNQEQEELLQEVNVLLATQQAKGKFL
ncbi:MAG: hypothetical protein QNJ36_21005 [Calothrix sp. MO_167.B42]|nr:hypothetical protein [Calothrix sp. MO_167.B42]